MQNLDREAEYMCLNYSEVRRAIFRFKLEGGGSENMIIASIKILILFIFKNKK